MLFLLPLFLIKYQTKFGYFDYFLEVSNIILVSFTFFYQPSGFKIEIANLNADNIVVGIRVQVGVQSTDRSPQYFEILGRMTQMKMAKNRWFDVPFTRDESMLIIAKENKFQILCMSLLWLILFIKFFSVYICI